MPRNTPPREPQAELVAYLRSCGIATKLLPGGWVAHMTEVLADPAQLTHLRPHTTEGQALVAYWEAWATETLDELEEMRTAYSEVMQALEAAGLDIRELPCAIPGTQRWSYTWHARGWSEDYASEGAAITAALIAMQQSGGASC